MGHVGHGSTVWWVTWVMGHERWPISISALRHQVCVITSSNIQRFQKLVHCRTLEPARKFVIKLSLSVPPRLRRTRRCTTLWNTNIRKLAKWNLTNILKQSQSVLFLLQSASQSVFKKSTFRQHTSFEPISPFVTHSPTMLTLIRLRFTSSHQYLLFFLAFFLSHF